MQVYEFSGEVLRKGNKVHICYYVTAMTIQEAIDKAMEISGKPDNWGIRCYGNIPQISL